MINDDITGIIFIDCWDIPELDFWYQRLSQHLNQFTRIQSMVVANYGIPLDSINNTSLRNSLKRYNHQQYRPEVLLPIIKNAGLLQQSSPYITSRYNKTAFALYDVPGFLIHTSGQDLRNWLVVGGGWKVCAHMRELGFVELQHIPDYNFYITPWSIHRAVDDNFNTEPLSDSDMVDDQVEWESIKDFGWRLKHKL